MEEFEDQDIKELIDRFRKMLFENEAHYFDSEEMEIIIDAFLANFEFELCEKAINHALSFFPNNAIFKILNVRKLRLDFEFEKAQKELQEIEKNYPPSLDFYKEKYSLLSLSADNYEESYSILMKAFHLDSQDPEINFYLSFEFLRKKELKKAINSIIIALQQEFNFEESLPSFILLFEETKQYEDALHFYKAITSTFPLSKEGWFGLGLAYGWLEKHNKAIEAYQFVISLDENTQSAYFNMGNAYYEMKNFNKAIECYKQALVLEPNDYNAIASIGDALNELESYDVALQYYRNALFINPQQQDAIMGIASILQEQGKEAEAEKFLEQVFINTPQSFENLFITLSNYEEGEEQTTKLLEFFEQMLSHEENVEVFFRHFALYCCNNACYQSGIVVFEQYRYHPEILDASNYYLAAFYYLSGYIEKGNSCLHDALMYDFEAYPLFLALDPILETFPEIINLIEAYQG